MRASYMVVELPSSTLVLFDPASLAHRRIQEAWMRSPEAVEKEALAGSLLALPMGSKQVALGVKVGHSSAGVETGRLEVRSGEVYAGDLSEAPSTRWGRRKWGPWDWLFWAFVVSLPPFHWWLFDFDRSVLHLAGAMTLVTIAGSLPFTWAVFRGTSEFARRTGIPPVDRPCQVVRLPAGAYTTRVEQTGSGIMVHLCPPA